MRRCWLIGALAACAGVCAGCGSSSSTTSAGAAAAASSPAAKPSYRVHPQAIEPVAGAGGHGESRSTPTTAGVSVSTERTAGSLPAPLSEAAIRRELARSGMSANPNRATLTADGLAVAPIGAPAAVQEIIDAGNQIAHLPYVWGGGHATYEDTGYDCSGSLSYVFAAAHLLDSTVTSGELAHWGDPGPGRWITVYANAGHTFMYVAGLRFDTVALAETGTRWSTRSADEPDLASFAVRHPPGL